MPQYKLIYFDLRAKGEVIRFLFALGGVEYEDVRIEFSEWSNKKQEVNPIFGQLPILLIDGVEYCQSFAIGRYLAEKFGYAGRTDVDKLRADMIVHCCEDLLTELLQINSADAEKKAELVAKFRDINLQTYFTNFEKILRQNNEGDGFFVGDSLTWADLIFFSYISFVTPFTGIEQSSFINSYPKLKSLLERVEKVPQVAEWIAKRPQNPF